MHGQFRGEVFAATNEPVGLFWTLVDPDVDQGHGIYVNLQTGRTFVAQINLLVSREDSGQFEIVPNRVYEGSYGLEDKVPDGTRVSARWSRNAAGELVGSFHYSGSAEVLAGSFKLLNLKPINSAPDVQLNSWAQCKEWMDSHVGEGMSLYRGQSKPLPLVTTFHRTGRVDLWRYIHQDMPTFADYVSTYSGRTYDWQRNVDRGALVGLAQHHGFPSPMLDWSKSPYIAASFAFSGVVEAAPSEDPVRLFRLTPQFSADFGARPGDLQVITPHPKVELFRPASLGNLRLLTQQGMLLFTNVASPEGLIRFQEGKAKRKYLEVVDVPNSICREALVDLRRMGITAAALFPGLDGIGLALKHELFYPVLRAAHAEVSGVDRLPSQPAT